MKRFFIQSSLASCLLLIIALAGCGGAGSRTTNESQPVAAPSPTPVSSSADVVKIRPQDVSVPAGGNIDAKVVLTISPGFHVNANPATFSYLIATEVTTGKVEGISVGAPVYPAAVKKKLRFAEQPLSVYEGEAPIKFNLRAEKNAASGPRSLPVTVRVQACDEEQCFPPATIKSTISVTVK